MAISLNKIVRVEWIDCRVDTLPTTAEESALVLKYIIANFHFFLDSSGKILWNYCLLVYVTAVFQKIVVPVV